MSSGIFLARSVIQLKSTLQLINITAIMSTEYIMQESDQSYAILIDDIYVEAPDHCTFHSQRWTPDLL